METYSINNANVLGATVSYSDGSNIDAGHSGKLHLVVLIWSEQHENTVHSQELI